MSDARCCLHTRGMRTCADVCGRTRQEVKSLRQHVQTCADEMARCCQRTLLLLYYSLYCRSCFCFTTTSKAASLQEVKSLRQHGQTCLDEMARCFTTRFTKGAAAAAYY
jgi:hypothetical protein